MRSRRRRSRALDVGYTIVSISRFSHATPTHTHTHTVESLPAHGHHARGHADVMLLGGRRRCGHARLELNTDDAAAANDATDTEATTAGLFGAVASCASTRARECHGAGADVVGGTGDDGDEHVGVGEWWWWWCMPGRQRRDVCAIAVHRRVKCWGVGWNG